MNLDQQPMSAHSRHTGVASAVASASTAGPASARACGRQARTSWRWLALLLALGLASPLAAVTPETGIWLMDAENNGQPGRGMQLEVQNNVLTMTFYGYLANGNAQWYITAGTLVNSNYVGTLDRYEGGTAFGQSLVAAHAAGNAGTVSMSFSDSTHGQITLPGEPVKSFSRALFGSGAVTVPGAPLNVAVAAGNASASLSFAPPASNGGAVISGYTATCTGGGGSRSATSIASPITVSAMSNGVSYSCTVAASNVQGTGPASASVEVTPTGPGSASFTLTSPVAASGGNLPAEYSCDGPGSTIALSWSNPPAGTQEYALLMTTLPGDGTTKWNWVLYGIPASRSGLAKDSFGVGTLGVGSDGPMVAYQPPCSQGPGAKRYTFTLYALSGSPVLAVPANQVSGAVLSSAIAGITLGSAALDLNYTRTSASGSTAACLNVRNSTAAFSSGRPGVGCDATYAYISSDGLTSDTMMDGIVATNLQVPTRQNFFGANAWKIPLNPAVAATTTSAVDGPIGIAVNGVPIFNPCKQGGCQNGDTKVLGELDVCNGHAGRADDYHYHAAPTCMMAGRAASYWDTHPIGWALDGFAIFGYNNADGSVATRDAVCGGNTLAVPNAPAGYSYHVTDVSPYVLACFRGTPSPDLANQASKFAPLRQPPVTPFPVSTMTLRTDASDGYQVLQFTSARNFTTTETGSDSYANPPGTYRIRYKVLSGAALATTLALPQNANKSMCWNFQFTDAAGTTTQPSISYCR